MNLELAFDQLRAANPVPGAGSLSTSQHPEGAVRAPDLRGADMGTLRTDDQPRRLTTPDTKHGHWKVPLVMAGVAALIVAIVAILLPGGGSNVVDTDSLGPDEAAAAFLAATGREEGRYWALIADQATLTLGNSITSESGRAAIMDQFTVHEALNVRHSDVTCHAIERTHERSGGMIVECDGRYEDAILDGLGVGAVSFQASYAVRDGQIVHFFDYEPQNLEAVDFVDDYMQEHHLDEMVAACWGPDSTGATCSAHLLRYLPELAEAWQARDSG